MISEGNSADWEYLPELCLLMVLEKIDAPISQVHFGAVCRHWQSIFNNFLDYRRRSSTNPVPLLLIPSEKNSRMGELYSLRHRGKVCEIELPKIQTSIYCGSCFGWLATMDKRGVIIILLATMEKFVLSDDLLLCPDNYFVGIIYTPDEKLAVLKSGQKDWIYINRYEFTEFHFSDIIFYKGLVYAIGCGNKLFSFDVTGIEVLSTEMNINILLPNFPTEEDYFNQPYLVKSSAGKLYVIYMHLYFDKTKEYAYAHSTKGFSVFKLILDEENGEFLEKKEVSFIDGDILLVGDNKVLVVSVLDFPEGKLNSIYFTDDFFYVNCYGQVGPRDIDIFHLKDRSFEKYFDFRSYHKHLPTYIWILPPVDFK